MGGGRCGGWWMPMWWVDADVVGGLPPAAGLDGLGAGTGHKLKGVMLIV